MSKMCQHLHNMFTHVTHPQLIHTYVQCMCMCYPWMHANMVCFTLARANMNTTPPSHNDHTLFCKSNSPGVYECVVMGQSCCAPLDQHVVQHVFYVDIVWSMHTPNYNPIALGTLLLQHVLTCWNMFFSIGACFLST